MSIGDIQPDLASKYNGNDSEALDILSPAVAGLIMQELIIQEAGRKSAETMQDVAADDASWESFAFALTGKTKAQRTPEQNKKLDKLRQDIRDGKIDPDFVIADGGADALPPGTLGVFVPGAPGQPGRVIMRGGMTAGQRRATAREETSEAVASRATDLGIEVADGDAGARGAVVLSGGDASDPQHSSLFADSPSDTVIATSEGQTVKVEANAAANTASDTQVETEVHVFIAGDTQDDVEVQVRDGNGNWITVQTTKPGRNNTLIVVIPGTVGQDDLRIVNRSQGDSIVTPAESATPGDISPDATATSEGVVVNLDDSASTPQPNGRTNVIITVKPPQVRRPNQRDGETALPPPNPDKLAGDVVSVYGTPSTAGIVLDRNGIMIAFGVDGATADKILAKNGTTLPEGKVVLTTANLTAMFASGALTMEFTTPGGQTETEGQSERGANFVTNGWRVRYVPEPSRQEHNEGAGMGPTTAFLMSYDGSDGTEPDGVLNHTELRNAFMAVGLNYEDADKFALVFGQHVSLNESPYPGAPRLTSQPQSRSQGSTWTVSAAQIQGAEASGVISFNADGKMVLNWEAAPDQAHVQHARNIKTDHVFQYDANNDSLLTEDEFVQGIMAQPDFKGTEADARAAYRLYAPTGQMARQDFTQMQLDGVITETGVVDLTKASPQVIQTAFFAFTAQSRGVPPGQVETMTASEFRAASDHFFGQVSGSIDIAGILSDFGIVVDGEQPHLSRTGTRNLFETGRLKLTPTSSADGTTSFAVVEDTSQQATAVQDDDEPVTAYTPYGPVVDHTPYTATSDYLDRGPTWVSSPTKPAEDMTRVAVEDNFATGGGFYIPSAVFTTPAHKSAYYEPPVFRSESFANHRLDTIVHSKDMVRTDNGDGTVTWTVTNPNVKSASYGVQTLSFTVPAGGRTDRYMSDYQGFLDTPKREALPGRGNLEATGTFTDTEGRTVQVWSPREHQFKTIPGTGIVVPAEDKPVMTVDGEVVEVQSVHLTTMPNGKEGFQVNYKTADGEIRTLVMPGDSPDFERTMTQLAAPVGGVLVQMNTLPVLGNPDNAESNFFDQVVAPGQAINVTDDRTDQESVALPATPSLGGSATLVVPTGAVNPSPRNPSVHKPPELRIERSDGTSGVIPITEDNISRGEVDASGNVMWTIGGQTFYVAEGSKLDRYLTDYKASITFDDAGQFANGRVVESGTTPDGEQYVVLAPSEHQFHDPSGTSTASTRILDKPVVLIQAPNGEWVEASVTGAAVGYSEVDGQMVIAIEVTNPSLPGGTMTIFASADDMYTQPQKGRAYVGMLEMADADGTAGDLSTMTGPAATQMSADFDDWDLRRTETNAAEDAETLQAEGVATADAITGSEEGQAFIDEQVADLEENGTMLTGGAMIALGLATPDEVNVDSVYYVPTSPSLTSTLSSLGFDTSDPDTVYHLDPDSEGASIGRTLLQDAEAEAAGPAGAPAPGPADAPEPPPAEDDDDSPSWGGIGTAGVVPAATHIHDFQWERKVPQAEGAPAGAPTSVDRFSFRVRFAEVPVPAGGSVARSPVIGSGGVIIGWQQSKGGRAGVTGSAGGNVILEIRYGRYTTRSDGTPSSAVFVELDGQFSTGIAGSTDVGSDGWKFTGGGRVAVRYRSWISGTQHDAGADIPKPKLNFGTGDITSAVQGAIATGAKFIAKTRGATGYGGVHLGYEYRAIVSAGVSGGSKGSVPFALSGQFAPIALSAINYSTTPQVQRMISDVTTAYSNDTPVMAVTATLNFFVGYTEPDRANPEPLGPQRPGTRLPDGRLIGDNGRPIGPANEAGGGGRNLLSTTGVVSMPGFGTIPVSELNSQDLLTFFGQVTGTVFQTQTGPQLTTRIGAHVDPDENGDPDNLLIFAESQPAEAGGEPEMEYYEYDVNTGEQVELTEEQFEARVADAAGEEGYMAAQVFAEDVPPAHQDADDDDDGGEQPGEIELPPIFVQPAQPLPGEAVVEADGDPNGDVVNPDNVAVDVENPPQLAQDQVAAAPPRRGNPNPFIFKGTVGIDYISWGNPALTVSHGRPSEATGVATAEN